jgi:hypothetical protein
VESDVCPLFFALGGEGALAYALQHAGFVRLSEERVATELVWKDDREALGAIFAGGPVALAYSRFSREVRDAVHAEYIESIGYMTASKGSLLDAFDGVRR